MAHDTKTLQQNTMLFLTGALVGATAGVLLTPQSEHQSREQLRSYVRKTGDQLRHFVKHDGGQAQAKESAPISAIGTTAKEKSA